MVKCLVCGKHFEAKRKDAVCCSSNCRHSLRRERKRRAIEYDAKNYGLFDMEGLRLEQELPLTFSSQVQELRLVFGKDVALFVLLLLAEYREYVLSENKK